MPAGPGQAIYEQRPYMGHAYNNNKVMREGDFNPDESAASILQSVKEQVTAFKILTDQSQST